MSRDYRSRNRHRPGYYRDRIAARNAAGLCGWCDEPNVLGRQRCQAHLDIENFKARARRAARGEQEAA